MYPESVALHLRLGRHYWNHGPAEKAKAVHERLVELQNGSPVSLFNLLRITASDGDPEASEMAPEMLRSKLPRDAEEFYFTGYANWLLGNEDRARYDFERSGTAPEEFYSFLE